MDPTAADGVGGRRMRQTATTKDDAGEAAERRHGDTVQLGGNHVNQYESAVLNAGGPAEEE
ncbi:hypothetical protein PF005_g21448 [Phytophthora fragariae]|uniref:Uncharacterized protein n=1 Tax=Phytophthora fragariae TaxID=53985 RepID=A0A6A3WGR8_9STRA|nr:hypothetical protein PF003_g26685 [Phytophthora fragariae]KAE8932946.1 hypothetical protein PF009_g17035 [Phytophthora fragariae]KAE8994287.1 hypothetical protein PF011_g16779 [Phytophthora fragariae]KAE9093835.1 hypothetical protein PF010_g17330 [Phytophthora fragariae]KAE9094416.1 hypothetical protein PF007_g17763 [Phytophthora fragariae]